MLFAQLLLVPVPWISDASAQTALTTLFIRVMAVLFLMGTSVQSYLQTSLGLAVGRQATVTLRALDVKAEAEANWKLA